MIVPRKGQDPLTYCTCGTLWDYPGYGIGQTPPEGWNICTSCGADQRKIDHSYKCVYLEPQPLDKLIEALVDGDVFTDEDTWAVDLEKNEMKNKIGKTTYIRKIQRTNPDLVVHVRAANIRGEYVARFDYPLHKKDGVAALFRVFNEDLDFAPIGEAGENTKTARGECAPRGGCGGYIQFPRPANIDILRSYPDAYSRAVNGEDPIKFQDYKLALQLHFFFGLPLKGKARPVKTTCL